MDDSDRPPGWYAISDRTEKYWDGTTWAAETRLTRPPGRWILISAVIGIVIIIAVAASTLLRSDDGGGRDGARAACERFVTQQLDTTADSAAFTDTHVSDLGGGHWSIRGAVADPGSGADSGSAALTYTCEIRHHSGDDWELVALDTTSGLPGG